MVDKLRVFFFLLFVGLLTALAVVPSCTNNAGAAKPADVVRQLLPVLEGFAAAAVQLHLTAAIAEKAPELLATLDANHDGAVTLEELRGADLAAPAVALVVLLTAERLIRER